MTAPRTAFELGRVSYPEPSDIISTTIRGVLCTAAGIMGICCTVKFAPAFGETFAGLVFSLMFLFVGLFFLYVAHMSIQLNAHSGIQNDMRAQLEKTVARLEEAASAMGTNKN